MFNKRSLMISYFAFLKAEMLAPEQVVLGAGGACVMHGIRTRTNDLDVTVPDKLFAKLRDDGSHEVRYYVTNGHPSCSVEYGDGISLHTNRYTRAIENVMISGVCCTDLIPTLAFKTWMNREKDQEDILALVKMIERRPANSGNVYVHAPEYGDTLIG